MLYPLKFSPIYKEKIWGGQKLKSLLNKNIPTDKAIGESWEISAIQDNLSVVSNGFLAGNTIEELVEVYMGDLVGEKVYAKFGIEFPLLIKYIDAADDLSIQVHPDDKLAKERHNAYGKNEMWYIIQADDKAKLHFGFNKELTKNEYLEYFNKGKLEEIIQTEYVEKTQIFENPAGRVHAIGKGTLLAEIQQTSDITYRIYDWKRKDKQGNYRELHTELAIDAINFAVPNRFDTEYSKVPNQVNAINKTKFFSSNYLKLDKITERDYSKFDSFIIYMIMDGNCTIRDEFNQTETLTKGETLLIPAELKNITIDSEFVELLEIYI